MTRLIGRISPNFTWTEMLKSDTAARRGISNQPSVMAASNLTRLAYLSLEPVRDYFGRPVSINSGYRGPALNTAVGGSKTSSHVIGAAVDIEIKGVSTYDVAKWCEDNLKYDQLILEAYSEGDPQSGWVHLSLLQSSNRNQALTWSKGKGYRNGLIR